MQVSVARGPHPRGRWAIQAIAVLALASSLGGCATNITGFDFPIFGLTQKSGDASAEQRQSAGLSQQQ